MKDILKKILNNIFMDNMNKKRKEVLDSYNILDTLPEEILDNIVLLASQITGCPISLISLIDEDRQWFKAKVGLDVDETPIDVAFCAHCVAKPEENLFVPDATKDERFKNNSLVTGDLGIVFYFGVPLMSSEDVAIGTLCAIDFSQKELTPDKIQALEALSDIIMQHFEDRKRIMGLNNMLKSFKESFKPLLSKYKFSDDKG
jgi:GAF domain-containing protein